MLRWLIALVLLIFVTFFFIRRPNTAVFHDFAFRDEQKESGITFIGRLVPDAHSQYDHGMGLAVADVNNDGLLDVYFVSQTGGNELWINNGGTFKEGTNSAVAMKESVNIGATFADIDNDGDADLMVSTWGNGLKIFSNKGGDFMDITTDSGLDRASGHLSGIVAFDYDRDGLLDLYVTSVGNFTTAEKAAGFDAAFPYATTIYKYPERVEQCYLFRNLGEKKFEDVTASAGMPCAPWSGDATFADLEDSGYPSLYALSMFGDDRYFENANAAFSDKTNQVFGKTPWGSMGVKFFDWNNDERMELYVTDMHSDMAYDQSPDEQKRKSVKKYPEEAEDSTHGNAFFENRPSGFKEISDSIGIETYWPWGVSIADINADGYQDVFVTAGMGSMWRYGINSLLLNDSGTRFVDSEFALRIEPRAGGETNAENGETRSSRSSAVFDVEGDGDLDIVTNEGNAAPQLLFSDLSERAGLHFLKISLRGTRSNRDGLGAKVTVHAGGRTYTQYNDGKSGYLSQSRMPLYFGLATAVDVDSIQVLWPSGSRSSLGRTVANGEVEIVESE